MFSVCAWDPNPPFSPLPVSNVHSMTQHKQIFWLVSEIKIHNCHTLSPPSSLGALKEYFAKYGPVLEVNLKFDRETGKSRYDMTSSKSPSVCTPLGRVPLPRGMHTAPKMRGGWGYFDLQIWLLHYGYLFVIQYGKVGGEGRRVELVYDTTKIILLQLTASIVEWWKD